MPAALSGAHLRGAALTRPAAGRAVLLHSPRHRPGKVPVHSPNLDGWRGWFLSRRAAGLFTHANTNSRCEQWRLILGVKGTASGRSRTMPQVLNYGANLSPRGAVFAEAREGVAGGRRRGPLSRLAYGSHASPLRQWRASCHVGRRAWGRMCCRHPSTAPAPSPGTLSRWCRHAPAGLTGAFVRNERPRALDEAGDSP
jgi:hypothetical protein